MENGVFVVSIVVALDTVTLLCVGAVACASTGLKLASLSIAMPEGLDVDAESDAESGEQIRIRMRRAEQGCRASYVLGLRAYVVCSLTVALTLRQSPHINQQIALNEHPAAVCERTSCRRRVRARERL